MHTQILGMPALSPTMTQGNIAAWHVKEGDEIAAGTVLADIETDKATLAFENQDDGFVAKLLLPAGARDVAVGAPVAVVVEEAEHVAAFADYAAPGSGSAGGAQPSASASGAAPSSTSAAAAPAPAAAAAKQQQPANFRLGPAARFALAEAGLAPGDIAAPTGPRGIVTKEDVLAAVAAGVKPGGSGGSGSGKAAAAPAAAAAAAAPQQQQPKAAAPQQQAAAASAAPPLSPPQQQQQQPAAARGKAGPRVSYTDVPNSQVRRIIAKRLLESKQTAPSLYVTADAPLAAVQALRKQLAAQGVKVSVNDCVVRAAALALRDVPEANAFWDAAAGAAARQPGVDVAIAVATDGGLITPIVRGADSKPLAAVAAEIRDLAARARANKLKPEEFMGGSFSVSNLGMFGLSQFSAIINPPQAAILAVGGARDAVTLGDEGAAPEASPVMAVTLSADHRVFDGELAARFLAAFSGHMANPIALVM